MLTLDRRIPVGITDGEKHLNQKSLSKMTTPSASVRMRKHVKILSLKCVPAGRKCVFSHCFIFVMSFFRISLEKKNYENTNGIVGITSWPSTERDMLMPFRGAAEGRKHDLSITRNQTAERFSENREESRQDKKA